MKQQNEQLQQQLKDQEADTIKAMKLIENQIEIETQKVIEKNQEEAVALGNKSNKELAHLEKQYTKQIADIREEKDKIMKDMLKMQKEKDLDKENKEAIQKKKKIE